MQEKYQEPNKENNSALETAVSLPVEKDPFKEAENLTGEIEIKSDEFSMKAEKEVTSGLASLKSNDPVNENEGKSLIDVFKQKAEGLKNTFSGKLNTAMLALGILAPAIVPAAPKQTESAKDTIFTSNQNDPRLKAFDDSTVLYQAGQNIVNTFQKTRKPGYAFVPEKMTPQDPGIKYVTEGELSALSDYDDKFKKDVTTMDAVQKRTDYQPAGYIEYTDQKAIDDMPVVANPFKKYKNDAAEVFGFNVPVFKKPVQPVIYKPEEKKIKTLPDVQIENKATDYKKRLDAYNSTQEWLAKFKNKNDPSLYTKEGRFKPTFTIVPSNEVPAQYALGLDDLIPANYIKVNYDPESGGENEYIPNYEKPIKSVTSKPKEKKENKTGNQGNLGYPTKEQMLKDGYTMDYEKIEDGIVTRGFTDTTGVHAGMYTYERIQDPQFRMQSLEPDLLEGKNELKIEKIPFKKGTYFTHRRDRQTQEPGSKQFGREGLVDFFDKKTGKLLGTYPESYLEEDKAE